MDDEAFRRVFEATRGPLIAYLRKIAGDPARADDLFQEAYVRLLNHPPRAEDPASVRSWLFTTATRLARDAWRSEKPHRWFDRWRDRPGEAPEVEPVDETPPVERGAWSQEAVAIGFDALSPRQRSLLWLAYVEGFDHRELARLFGVSRASVRVLLSRARARMSAALSGVGVEGSER